MSKTFIIIIYKQKRWFKDFSWQWSVWLTSSFRAVKDCTYVLHVASPFPAENPRDEMEVIRPAVEGTKNVLDACAKTKGAVKRVVVTGSVVAMYGENKCNDATIAWG